MPARLNNGYINCEIIRRLFPVDFETLRHNLYEIKGRHLESLGFKRYNVIFSFFLCSDN